jgi:hypothetical protein
MPFHMTEFHARNLPQMKGKTPFDGWTDAHAHAVFGGLTGIIANRVRHRGVGIATGVVIRDYEEVVSGTREPVSRYMFCVLRCLYQAAQWRRENGITDNIAFVFESGADTGNKLVNAETEVANAAAHIKGDPDLRAAYGLKSLRLESKREYFPLQAADIAAWAARRYEITGGDIEPDVLAHIETLKTKVKHISERWDKRALEEYKSIHTNMSHAADGPSGTAS